MAGSGPFLKCHCFWSQHLILNSGWTTGSNQSSSYGHLGHITVSRWSSSTCLLVCCITLSPQWSLHRIGLSSCILTTKISSCNALVARPSSHWGYVIKSLHVKCTNLFDRKFIRKHIANIVLGLNDQIILDSRLLDAFENVINTITWHCNNVK